VLYRLSNLLLKYREDCGMCKYTRDSERNRKDATGIQSEVLPRACRDER
jgi:hypothetical protein